MTIGSKVVEHATFPVALGPAIRRRREAEGLRREALGLAIGRTAQSVMLYELGQVTPPLWVLGRIAAQLGCSVSDLLEDRP